MSVHQNRNDVQKRKRGQAVASDFPTPTCFKKHLKVVTESKTNRGKKRGGGSFIIPFHLPPFASDFISNKWTQTWDRGDILPVAASLLSQRTRMHEARSALTFLTLLSHSLVRGQCFVIIMPHFTVCQGNSITSMWTGLAFVSGE